MLSALRRYSAENRHIWNLYGDSLTFRCNIYVKSSTAHFVFEFILANGIDALAVPRL